MDNNGFSGTKIVGYDHNWGDAAGYPITLVRSAPFEMLPVRYAPPRREVLTLLLS